MRKTKREKTLETTTTRSLVYISLNPSASLLLSGLTLDGLIAVKLSIWSQRRSLIVLVLSAKTGESYKLPNSERNIYVPRSLRFDMRKPDH